MLPPYLLLPLLLAPLCPAQPPLSHTPTSTPSPTPSLERPLCPQTTCAPYTYNSLCGSASDFQYWIVPASPTYEYLYVALWGAGGGRGLSVAGDGSYGAFVAGALRVYPGEVLRIIIGGYNSTRVYCSTPNEMAGCPGVDSVSVGQLGDFVSGGRTAIQRNSSGGEYEDVLAVGGGGGPGSGSGYVGGGHGSSGSVGGAGHGVCSAAGGSIDAGGNCVAGVRSCGGSDLYSSGGGGGWCGGTTLRDCKDHFFIAGGGGATWLGVNDSALACAVRADYMSGNFFNTPVPGKGAGTPGARGKAVISMLPTGWTPCTYVE